VSQQVLVESDNEVSQQVLVASTCQLVSTWCPWEDNW